MNPLSVSLLPPGITVDPKRRFGQPCIRQTRISVWDVMSYFGSGMSEDEILSDFLQLTREDLQAAHQYVAQFGHEQNAR